MKILLCGNCQTQGLQVFLQRALPSFDIRCIPHLATFYGEFTEEQIADHHAWADLVFFHHKHDHPQDYPTKQPKIPLSVWFQSAPFIAQIPEDLWIEFRNGGGNSEDAIHYDFNYSGRWEYCLQRMQEKEESENVPKLLRMSDLMFVSGRGFQLQLTCNHPTSLVLRLWSYRICNFLQVREAQEWSFEECLQNPNIAGLPCEESATSGARKHLGLRWGGRPEDDESGRFIARERLAKLL
jgi:hypothetical protein